jgi:hypothetical protein
MGDASNCTLFYPNFREPFTKVLAWFNSQVSMEEVYRFPLLRLKPSDPPLFAIPAKAGLRLYPNVKTIPPTVSPFIPYFCKRLQRP